MKFGSVCSGIEAASVAWHPLGWRAAWLSEIEPFPCAVLAHHYPDVPNIGDMTTLPSRIASGEIEAPDLFCGGTPCQAFSVAGLRKSLDDARGNLSLVFCEIANAIDARRAGLDQLPAIIFWENVPGVLNTNDNAFGCFLAGLAGEDDPLIAPGGKWSNAGCVFGPARTVAWRVLDAQYFGVAQRRRRVFVVASARTDIDTTAILFEFDGVRRDTAPSREARQTAPTIPARSTAGGGLGTDFDCDGGVITMAQGQVREFVGALCKNSFVGGLGCRPEGAAAGHFLPVAFPANLSGTQCASTEDIAPAMGAKNPTGVTIHGTDPTVQKVASYDELAQCLRARTPGNIDNSSTTVVQQPVAYGIRTANTSSNGWGIQEEVTHTLDCAQGAAGAHAPAIAFAENSQHEIRLDGGDGQRTGALSTGGGKPGQGTPMVAVLFDDPRRFDTKGVHGGGNHGDLHPTLEATNPKQILSISLRGREGGATTELGDEEGNFLRASSGGGDKAHVLAPVVDTLYNKGIATLKEGNASTQETYPGTLLRTLRQEVGEEAFAKWGLGILDSLQSPEILRQALHGFSIRPAAFSRSWVVYCALSRQEDGSGWLLQSLREAECERCSSPGWEPPEQLARELGAYLSELPQPGAQAARFLHDLWQASQGLWILRQALSAIQEMGRSAGGQGQSILGSSEGRGEESDENVLSSGMQCQVSRERVLHKTCAAGEARDSREGTTEQERSGKGWVGETPFAVRRLTPTEVERLMGFPDGYTAIPWRKKPASECPDGPRYRSLGNSWAVPNVRWIGQRIDLAVKLSNSQQAAAT